MNKLRCGAMFVALGLLLFSMVAEPEVRPSSAGLYERSWGELTPKDQPEEAEEFYRLKRLPEGQTRIPIERYLMAMRQMNQMPRHSLVLGTFLDARPESMGTWFPLGPGNIGGRTRALLIDPTDPGIMYAAGVAGGVWKSTNAGASWTPRGDLLPNIAINSMAMDPRDPKVIYAGTGEGFFNGDSVRGGGIFKTTDGGFSWSLLSSTINNEDFYYVNDIVISPNNSQRVYAATRTGVWRSTNGGQSWSRALDPQVQGGCLDLAIRTDQGTDYIFASCGTFAQATVYRNVNAAGSGAWEAVLTEEGMGRTSLAIAPSNQNIIYALASSITPGPYNRGLHAVFRSEASGDPGSWTAQVRNTNINKLNTVLLSNPIIAFLSECNFGTSAFLNQGWYDNVIAVDPTNPNRVWVGGIDLFRSDDGGMNWGIASYWWADNVFPQYAHADHHVIVFHPQYDGVINKVMFVGNDGGLFRTDDATAPTSANPCNPSGGMRWTSLNNNYGVTQFYHGLPYPNGTIYFGGTQDNGTLRGDDQSGPNAWAEIFGGDGGYVAVDPNNTDIIYVETTRLSLRKSTDGGRSFSSATNGIAGDDRFLFIAPFTMDPSDSQRLWIGGKFIWKTTDGAANWRRASDAIPESSQNSISAIAVAPTNPDRVLVGTSRGHIIRNDSALGADQSTIWPSVQPRAGFVSWVAFDPTNDQIAYATYSTFGGNHVWRSTDGGASWSPIDNGLPDIPVHCIVIDPTNTARLFIGTDLGVFVSLDGGVSWAVENTGFANVVTESLSLISPGKMPTLFAFTHGRGAWRVALMFPPAPVINGAAISGKHLIVTGQNFDLGAQIIMDGEPRRTRNDEQNPTTTLIGKKLGKRISPGQTVELRVRNTDGSLSNIFRFTRPAN
jgi:photosystem II stability/assembly factor-like uncharacterized protein